MDFLDKKLVDEFESAFNKWKKCFSLFPNKKAFKRDERKKEMEDKFREMIKKNDV